MAATIVNVAMGDARALVERFRESLPGTHLDLVSGLPIPSSSAAASAPPLHSPGLVRIVTGCIAALFTLQQCTQVSRK